MSKMIRPERRARAARYENPQNYGMYEDPLTKVMEARTYRDVLVRILVRQESTTRLRKIVHF